MFIEDYFVVFLLPRKRKQVGWFNKSCVSYIEWKRVDVVGFSDDQWFTLTV